MINVIHYSRKTRRNDFVIYGQEDREKGAIFLCVYKLRFHCETPVIGNKWRLQMIFIVFAETLTTVRSS